MRGNRRVLSLCAVPAWPSVVVGRSVMGAWPMLALGVALVCLPQPSAAQQATVTTPMVTTGDSFFEQIGTSWGFNFGNNGFVRFGSPGGAAAPFGNAQPGAGMNLGFGGPNGYFNLGAAQGSRRSIVSQAPSVTLQNGVPGFFSDTSQSPFVIGQIPVVGGAPAIPYSSFVSPPGGFGLRPTMPVMGAAPSGGNWRVQQALQQMRRSAAQPSPGDAAALGRVDQPAQRARAALARRGDVGDPAADVGPGGAARPAGDLDLVGGPAADGVARGGGPAGDQSSAARAAPSVAEALEMRQQARRAAGEGNQQARLYLERGITAEQSGKAGAARVYYQMALRRAEGPLRSEIAQRLAALGQ